MIAAYFIGSFPTGKLLVALHKKDVQKRGSLNIGFINCCRVIGFRAAIPVLIIDVAKGWLPVFLFYPSFSDKPLLHLLLLLAPILGHIFPVWLKFKGGKGVATGLGVGLALNPVITVIVMAIWLTIFLIFRFPSLASLLSFLVFPIAFHFIGSSDLRNFYLIVLLFMGYAHFSNIKRLLKHKEKKLI